MEVCFYLVVFLKIYGLWFNACAQTKCKIPRLFTSCFPEGLQDLQHIARRVGSIEMDQLQISNTLMGIAMVGYPIKVVNMYVFIYTYNIH